MKKRGNRLNVKKLMIFMVSLILLIFLVYMFFTYDTKNIYVINNDYLSDQKIIDLADLSDYPNFFTVTKTGIRRRIMVNPYIKEVAVQKKWLGKIYMYIDEQKPLFYKNRGILVLENKEEISEDSMLVSVPLLANVVPDEYYDKLVEEVNKLDPCVISKISQIEYKPNDVDPERFLLYMKDGNYVYLTLLEFNEISNYNEIVLLLEGETGILYLDLGHHFEIIE